MASIIKVETLQDTDGNNAVGMQYVSKGSAKLWGSFGMSDGAIVESFNVSSVADNGTGDHSYTSTVTFAHNTKHGGVAATCTNNIGFARLAQGNCTTTVINLFTHLHSGGNTDIDRTLSIIGDLA